MEHLLSKGTESLILNQGETQVESHLRMWHLGYDVAIAEFVNQTKPPCGGFVLS